ncbi:M23 family metallopeptidase [Flavihumibacter petaseus]|uniref:Peptidase M23 family protein n=1 Tax=Flavihumibacter petaseus NBRC 106054 TaxID=1220578 RepID=A0A0E9N457_9BACT|nr:M23 family metallopeptidase [Flavihumibacter petaseus]GAO44609.1 peptidase M23 family protein [Flavihumibacter petaseus NBRC 106054]
MKKIARWLFFAIGIVLLLGYLLPERFDMPVEHAGLKSYDQQSFWYYPWGESGTHKGVDIFAKKGTRVNAATSGLVLYTGNIRLGGNVVLVLGPHWKFHYYAHLDGTYTSGFCWVQRGSKIGTVGDSGNAKGKPAHLHYTIKSIVPLFWKIDLSKQGWKKMFYLNPIPYLNTAVQQPHA